MRDANANANAGVCMYIARSICNKNECESNPKPKLEEVYKCGQPVMNGNYNRL